MRLKKKNSKLKYIYPDDKSIGPVDCCVGAVTIVGGFGLFKTFKS